MTQGKGRLEALRKRTVSKAIKGLEFVPDPPERLKEAGAAVWRVYLKERAATIVESELSVLQRLCELTDCRENLLVILENDGWTVPGSQPDTMYPHPAAKLLTIAESEMRQLERVLSIGASHRARLQLEVLAVQNELDKRQFRASLPLPAAGGPEDP